LSFSLIIVIKIAPKTTNHDKPRHGPLQLLLNLGHTDQRYEQLKKDSLYGSSGKTGKFLQHDLQVSPHWPMKVNGSKLVQ
jgi:hypothetical protein